MARLNAHAFLALAAGLLIVTTLWILFNLVLVDAAKWPRQFFDQTTASATGLAPSW